MSDFYELARAAEADPSCADFATLRRAYVSSGVYNPAKHIMQSKLMQITNSAASFAEVAEICRNILAANPMDLEARRVLALAVDKLGDPLLAEKHDLFIEKMIDAILAEGDGKSIESAWQVIAEAEIWTLFKIFEMLPQQDTRHRRPDGIFDVFEGVIKDRAVTMVFDVTAPVMFIERMVDAVPE